MGEEITVHGAHQTEISWLWVAEGIKEKEVSSVETMGLRGAAD